MLSREVCQKCRRSSEMYFNDVREVAQYPTVWRCPHTFDLVRADLKCPPKDCLHLYEQSIASSLKAVQ